MDLTINTGRVLLSPTDGSLDPFFMANRKLFRVDPMLLYRWDCSTARGTPTKRIEDYTLDADAILDVGTPDATRPFVTMRGEENLATALAAVGLSDTKDLQSALDLLVPSKTIPVPYDVLLDPLKQTCSVEVWLQEHAALWQAVFVGNGHRAQGYIQVPLAWRFWSVVTEVCSGSASDLLYSQRTQAGRTALTAKGRTLVQDHHAGLVAQRKALKQAAEDYEAWLEARRKAAKDDASDKGN